MVRILGLLGLFPPMMRRFYLVFNQTQRGLVVQVLGLLGLFPPMIHRFCLVVK